MKTTRNVKTFSIPLILCLLLIPATLFAATYYVANDGLDSNNGTSSTTPWQTIAKVNGKTFSHGDAILFKCGGTWREELIIKNSGTSDTGGRITFGAYGTGNKPVICGSNAVTGTWTQYSTNIWQATFVWVNPHDPDVDFPAPDVVFFNGTHGVKKSSLAALGTDQIVNSWFWQSDNILYAYSLTAPTDVEVGERMRCIYGAWNANADYITIQDLELKYSLYQLIHIDPTDDNWVIKNVTAHHNGRLDDIEDGGTGNNRVGFHINDSDNNLITGCTIYETGENAIQIVGGANNIVEHCTIYNPHHHCIDMKGNYYDSTSTKACVNNIIRYNKVYATDGFTAPINGIYLGPSNYQCPTGTAYQPLTNTLIYNNTVYGITDNGILIDDSPQNTYIFNNVVANGVGTAYAIEGSDLVTLKNNIGIRSSTSSWNVLLQITDSTGKTLDNNCWYSPVTANIIQVDCPLGDTTGDHDYTNNPSIPPANRNWAAYKSLTGFDSHSIIADPLVADLANHDYHLQSGSPCKDAGIDWWTPLGISDMQDFDSNPIQGSPDIGAYEYQSSVVNYNLGIAITPVGAGTVALNPAGGIYSSGTQVTLTANPNSGYSFSNWSGSVTGTTNPVTITMNAGKSVTATFTQIVTAPVAGFSATPVTGTMPLAVQFTDASTNTPTSWSWNFGDAGTSTLKSPSHTYTIAGTYTVALTATNAGGFNTKTVASMITVNASTVPAAPTSLSSPSKTKNSISIQWNDNATNESGYDVERSTSSSFSPRTTVTVSLAANATTYNITGLSRYTTYYIRLRAKNGSVYSLYSNTINVRTNRS